MASPCDKLNTVSLRQRDSAPSEIKKRFMDVRDFVCSRDNVPSPARMHAPAKIESAPSAHLHRICCIVDTATGWLIALQNLANGTSSLPALVSLSYGECEAYNGASSNAAYNAVYELPSIAQKRPVTIT
jgi:hypothetical protein